MGLRIKQPWWLKTQGIVTLIAVFAFIAQPMYGVVADSMANALQTATPTVEFKTASGTVLTHGSTTNEKYYTFTLNASDVTEQSYFNMRLSVAGTDYQNHVQKLSGTGNPRIGAGGYSNGNLTVLGDGNFGHPTNGGQGTYTAEFQVCKTAAECSPYTQPVSVTYNASYVAPVITSVDAYYLTGHDNDLDKDWTGIGVGFDPKNISSAESIELRVNRTDESTYSVFANPSRVDAINANNAYTSGVIVIAGARDSGSWNNQTGTWTGTALPESVDVIITLKNGDKVTQNDDTIGSTLATQAEVLVDLTPPTFEITNLAEGQLVGTANTNKLVVKGTLTDPSGARVLLQLVKPGKGVVADNVTRKAPVENGTLAEFSTAGLDSGAYELHVRPTDYKGNAIPFHVIKFNMDTKFPSFKINTPANGSTVSGAQTVTAEIADDSDVTKVQFSMGGTSTRTWEKGKSNPHVTRDGNLFSIKFDTASLSDGDKQMTLRAIDGAGNVRYWNNNATIHSFKVDNTAPKITSVEMGEVRAFNGLNLTGLKLNSNKLAVTFTTNEPLKVSRSQVSLRVPAISNAAPATGWTGIQKVGENKYVANIDLVNSTNSSVSSNWKNFFIDKFYEDINLYFQLTDELDNNKNTYYAVDPVTGGPIDGWTTDSGDERNYKFTLDNKAPVVTINSPEASGPTSGAVDIVATIDDENLSHYYLLVKTRTDSSQAWTTLYEETVDSDEFSENKLYTVPSSVSGEVVVLLEAKDRLGNKHTTQSNKKIYFDVDNTKPRVTLPVLDKTYNPKKVNVDVTDNYNVGNVQYSIGAITDNGYKELVGYRDFDSSKSGDTYSSSLLLGLTSAPKAKHDIDRFFKEDFSLVDGDYVLRVRAFDNVGNKNSGNDVKFTVDNTAPKVSDVKIESMNSDKVVGGEVKVNFTMTDDSEINFSKSLTHVRFMNGKDMNGKSVPNSDTYAVQRVGSTDEYFAVVDTKDFVPAGTVAEQFRVYIRTEDKVGKGNQTGVAFYKNQITIDNQAPGVTLSPQDGSVGGVKSYKQSQNVSVEIDELHRDRTEIRDKDGNVVKKYDESHISFTLESGLKEGEYTVVHIDQAGNETEVKFVISRTSSKIVNISGILPSGDNFFSNRDGARQKFSFDVDTSNGLALERIRVAIDEFNPSDDKNGWGGKQVFNDYDYFKDSTDGKYTVDLGKIINDSDLKDGQKYTILIQTKNEANVHDTRYLQFTVDNTAPDAPIVTPDATVSNIAKGSSFKISVSPESAGDSITSSVKDSLGNVYTSDNKHSYIIDTTKLKKSTTITINATSKDAAGNVSEVKSATYIVDNGAPLVKIVSLHDSSDGIFVLSGTSGFAAGSKVTVSFNDQVRTGFTQLGGAWSVEVGELAAETRYNFFVTISETILGYSRDAGPFPHLTDPVRGSGVDRVDSASAVFIPGETEPVEIAGDESTEPTVLGSEDSRVQGDTTKNTAALTPSEEGWKLFGTAWYWWLAALAAIGAFLWWLAAAIRRRQTQEI